MNFTLMASSQSQAGETVSTVKERLVTPDDLMTMGPASNTLSQPQRTCRGTRSTSATRAAVTRWRRSSAVSTRHLRHARGGHARSPGARPRPAAAVLAPEGGDFNDDLATVAGASQHGSAPFLDPPPAPVTCAAVRMIQRDPIGTRRIWP